MLSFQPCGVVIANMDKLYPCEVSLKLKGQSFLFSNPAGQFMSTIGKMANFRFFFTPNILCTGIATYICLCPTETMKKADSQTQRLKGYYLGTVWPKKTGFYLRIRAFEQPSIFLLTKWFNTNDISYRIEFNNIFL